ncbi:MAG TPA: hypothetical protein VF236_08570 [Gaiellaceae bacterium]
MTDIGRPEPPERGLFARIAVDIRPLQESRDFAASPVAIWLLPSAPPAPEAEGPSLAAIVDGFWYVRRKDVLLGIFLVDTNAMIFGMPRALFPAFAEKLGVGAGLLGLMYSAPFAGAPAADFVSAVLRSNILLTETPDSMRGRVSGIELAQVAGAPERGNVEAGIVAELAGVRASIVSDGVLTVIGTVVVAMAVPALVRYDARKPQQE